MCFPYSLCFLFACFLSACELVHCVVDTEYLAEEEVKGLDRKYCLPETYEVESEWDTLEYLVLLNSLDYLLGYILRLEDWDDA